MKYDRKNRFDQYATWKVIPKAEHLNEEFSQVQEVLQNLTIRNLDRAGGNLVLPSEKEVFGLVAKIKLHNNLNGALASGDVYDPGGLLDQAFYDDPGDFWIVTNYYGGGLIFVTPEYYYVSSTASRSSQFPVTIMDTSTGTQIPNHTYVNLNGRLAIKIRVFDRTTGSAQSFSTGDYQWINLFVIGKK